LRVDDWRVIYELEQRQAENPEENQWVLVVFVLTVAPRGGAYQ
jgi:hypothetical protein